MKVRMIGVALAAVAAYLAWAIVVALRAESVFAAAPRLTHDPWGWVTIVDLYAGFALVAGYFAWRERHARRYLPWIVALACLGNLASIGYVLATLVRHGFDVGALFRPAE